jgi:hypothetical protein
MYLLEILVYDFNNFGPLAIIKHFLEHYLKKIKMLKSMRYNSYIGSQIMKVDSILLFITLSQLFCY